MSRCETCGNEYETPLEVRINGAIHLFDSFECAIHKLAPRCDHCSCRIIGHGIQARGKMFCCAHCARHSGVTEARDHV